MGSDNEVAVIGLDGLDPDDVERFNVRGRWHELDIETVAQTCPSWNAIFSGQELDGVYDFWELTDDVGPGMLAPQSDERFEYEDIRTDDHVWERDDITADGEGVEVVTAPVVLPTYSSLGPDERPGDELFWCVNRNEIDRSIEELTEMTLEYDRVITVFPVPDKMHHHVANDEKRYTVLDRSRQMKDLDEAIGTLTDAFDRYLLLSDHGRPSGPENVKGNVQVPSHEPTGVVRSNAVDTSKLTNLTVYDRIVEILTDD